MNTLLKQELITRIKNNKCFVCGKDNPPTTIFHKEFGEVKVCIEHLKEKIE